MKTLTLGFGADEAGRRVAEGAQDGADGEAQVLVTRVQSHRGEAEVGQLRGFLRTDLHVRDLKETERSRTSFYNLLFVFNICFMVMFHKELMTLECL